MLLSDTKMQAAFNNQYQTGEMFIGNEVQSFIEKLKKYKNTNLLNNQRQHNYDLAINQLNWEQESKKLLAVIEDTVLFT